MLVQLQALADEFAALTVATKMITSIINNNVNIAIAIRAMRDTVAKVQSDDVDKDKTDRRRFPDLF